MAGPEKAHKETAALSEITIEGRAYKIGTLTRLQVVQSWPDRERMNQVRLAGRNDLDECYEEFTRVSIVLLQQHSPDVTVALFENMTRHQVMALQAEFMRQLDALATETAKQMMSGPAADNA